MEYTLLINHQDIINFTQIDGSIDFEKLKPSILNAQVLYTQKILGSNLYNRIIDLVNDDNISVFTYYQTLLYDYVTPSLVMHTLELFEPLNSSVLGDNGTFQYNLSNAAAAARAEIDRKVKIYQMQASNFDDMLQKYILKNITEFAEYNDADGLVQKTVEQYPKIGWNLSMKNSVNKIRY